MKSLPRGLKPYKRTPTFTQATVPNSLLRDHATKSGVWGLIHVLEGKIIYRIADDQEEHLLAPGYHGVVEPEVLHSVELVGETQFFVEFWTSQKFD